MSLVAADVSCRVGSVLSQLRRKSVQLEGRRARAHEARAVEEERLRHRALSARAPSMACAGGDGGGSSPATAPAAQVEIVKGPRKGSTARAI